MSLYVAFNPLQALCQEGGGGGQGLNKRVVSFCLYHEKKRPTIDPPVKR